MCESSNIKKDSGASWFSHGEFLIKSFHLWNWSISSLENLWHTMQSITWTALFSPAPCLQTTEEQERFFRWNIWSLLKGRKFIAAERLHLRAQGIATVFASHRDNCHGTRASAAVREGNQTFIYQRVCGSPEPKRWLGPSSHITTVLEKMINFLTCAWWGSSCGRGLRSWLPPPPSPTMHLESLN